MRAQFIVAYSASNIFSLNIIPVTNEEFLREVIAGNERDIAIFSRRHGIHSDYEAALMMNLISEGDLERAVNDPDGMHRNATFTKAKLFCDDAKTITWADKIAA